MLWTLLWLTCFHTRKLENIFFEDFKDLKLFCNVEYVRKIFRQKRTWILRTLKCSFGYGFIFSFSVEVAREATFEILCVNFLLKWLMRLHFERNLWMYVELCFAKNKKCLCIMLYTLSVRTCRFCWVLFFFTVTSEHIFVWKAAIFQTYSRSFVEF